MTLRSFVIVSIIFGTASLRSQPVDQMNRLQLAQQFEAAGMWERAATTYEELHRIDTTNFIYFDGLLRSYTQIKEYDKSVALIQQRLLLQPGDPILQTSLGGLRYDMGQDSLARVVWNAVLDLNSTNDQIRHLVVREMLEHRLYDDAIDVYLRGRERAASPSAYSSELSNLYAMMQRFPDATREHLLRLRAYPDQLPAIQSQMAGYISKPQALQEAVFVVATESDKTPVSVPVLRLLAWLHIEQRDFDRALAEYRRVDELTNARGAELLQFAQRLLQEKAYRQAREAYSALIASLPDPPASTSPRTHVLTSSLLFGYARSCEELGLLPEAMTTYEKIVNDYAPTEQSIQSLFRIGIIQFDHIRDLDSAITVFRMVKSSPRAGALVPEASVRIAEALVAKNDLLNARTEYKSLAGLPLSMYQDIAVLRLAELDYYESRFDTALIKLERFTTNTNTDIANDALRLGYFIRENMNASDALKQFASADLFMRRGKYAESLGQFQDVIVRYPSALLIDDAWMRVGELNVTLGRADSAIAAFRTVTDSVALSIWKDRAQFRIAEINETLRRDVPAAITAYELLLEKYPNSLFAATARQRIRSLREPAIRP